VGSEERGGDGVRSGERGADERGSSGRTQGSRGAAPSSLRRGDLAERYAEWGWPATAVLTSDARPVLELRGFQDPEEFVALLRELIAERDAGKLQGRRPAPVAAPPNTDLLALRRAAEAQLDATYDLKLGGWGRKQKYPLAALDELSLLRARLFAAPDWQARALTTIAAEIQLIDPVWGGMYQYSVGGTWDQPHYEKIGAIQAGALESLALAYRRTADERWRSAAHLQRRYVLGPMQHPEGGFFTSQDADLQRPGQAPVLGLDYYAKTDAERRALGIPRVDEHRYADINARMISALCLLHASVPGPDAQYDPDGGRFSTVASANPELPVSMAMGVTLAEAVGAQLVLATDPDADRLGATARGRDGAMVAIDGNRLGVLMLDHIMDKMMGRLPANGWVLTTLVTTPLLGTIARAHGIEVVDDLLVGFKHHAGMMGEQPGKTLIFGCEESHGYIRGDDIRDKDGAIAALLLAECAAVAHALDHRHPAHEQGRREAGEISDHAAPESDDRVASTHAAHDHRPDHLEQRSGGLERLPGGDDDRHHGEALGGEVGRHVVRVQRRHRGVGDQRHRAGVAEALLQLGAEAGDRPATDQHRIAVALGRHVHVDHQRTRTLRFAW